MLQSETLARTTRREEQKSSDELHKERRLTSSLRQKVHFLGAGLGPRLLRPARILRQQNANLRESVRHCFEGMDKDIKTLTGPLIKFLSASRGAGAKTESSLVHLLRTAVRARRALQWSLWAARAPGGVRVACIVRPRSTTERSEADELDVAPSADAWRAQDKGLSGGGGGGGGSNSGIHGHVAGVAGVGRVGSVYSVACRPEVNEVWVTGAAQRGRGVSAGGGDNERRVFRFDAVYQGTNSRGRVYGEIRPVVRAALEGRSERAGGRAGGRGATDGPVGGEACVVASDAATWDESLGESAAAMVLRALFDDAQDLCAGMSMDRHSQQVIAPGGAGGGGGWSTASDAAADAFSYGAGAAAGGDGACSEVAPLSPAGGIQSISLSVVEIYNERVYDLLVTPLLEPHTKTQTKKKKKSQGPGQVQGGGGVAHASHTHTLARSHAHRHAHSLKCTR